MIPNFGIQYLKTAQADNFTSNLGIRLRRWINPLLRRALRLGAKHKIVVERYPKLQKGTPYIFASTHFFDEDIIANLICVDRNSWVLIGTTDQFEHNRQMYAAWLNGLIYVDRLDSDSRKDSLCKMKRILHAGSSVVLFPEGGWNNTENLLVQKLFGGPWLLAKDTGCQVVPVAPFYEFGQDTIYMRYGNPLSLAGLERKDALRILRDEMATLLFESIEAHATPIRREELKGNFHQQHMQTRRKAYLQFTWTRDVWDAELTVYRDKLVPLPSEVCTFVDDVKITPANAKEIAPFLVEREREIQLDFKAYMKRTWNIDNRTFDQ